MTKTIDTTVRVEWSRELNVEFIADYKNLKVIWDPSMRHLKLNRVQAVKSLCDKYNLSPDEVRGRIKVLRTSFHREHIKVQKSLNSDEIYSPKWYGYELLRFLVDDIDKDNKIRIKNEADDSFHISDATMFDINFLNYQQLKNKESEQQNDLHNKNSLDNQLPKNIEMNTNDADRENYFKSPQHCDKNDSLEHKDDKHEEITIKCDNILFSSTKESVDLNDENTDMSIEDAKLNVESETPPSKRTKMCIPNVWGNNFATGSCCHSSCDNKERDEFLVFGENVAVTLRNLKNDKSKIIAKHMINNILFDAQMGKFDQ